MNPKYLNDFEWTIVRAICPQLAINRLLASIAICYPDARPQTKENLINAMVITLNSNLREMIRRVG